MPVEYGIVYTTTNKVVMRLVVPEGRERLTRSMLALKDNESVYIAPWIGDNSIETAKAILLANGIDCPSGRCALVSPRGVVAAILIADPDLFSISGFTVIPSDLANVGDAYIAGHLNRKLATVNQTTRIVEAVGFLPYPPPTTPGMFFIPAGDLKVGDSVSVKTP